MLTSELGHDVCFMADNNLKVYILTCCIKGEGGVERKNELMMLANISPHPSIQSRKWLSGSQAAWSSIASDSQSRCNCPSNRARLLLTNAVRRGRDQDALLSVPGAGWLFSWQSW